jgi:hypothetical protein
MDLTYRHGACSLLFRFLKQANFVCRYFRTLQHPHNYSLCQYRPIDFQEEEKDILNPAWLLILILEPFYQAAIFAAIS